MSRHTPGPWQTEGLLVVSTRGDQVASVWNIQGGAINPDPESLSNARLIAAAPALVKALRNILEEAEGREDTEDNPSGEGVRPNAWMIVASLCRDALDAAGVLRG